MFEPQMDTRPVAELAAKLPVAKQVDSSRWGWLSEPGPKPSLAENHQRSVLAVHRMAFDMPNLRAKVVRRRSDKS